MHQEINVLMFYLPEKYLQIYLQNLRPVHTGENAILFFDTFCSRSPFHLMCIDPYIYDSIWLSVLCLISMKYVTIINWFNNSRPRLT